MALRVLHTSLVAPSPPLHHHRSVPLTYLDAMWLTAEPVQRLFFYRLAPDAEFAAIVANLTVSLSHTLHAFFPLAARLQPMPHTPNRYHLHYDPTEGASGVAFTVAEYDGADVDHLASDDPREHAKLHPLVPRLPDGGAVLALQATLLGRRRRGLALGVTVHHAACDGAASTHFLHTWAAACAGVEPPPPPPVVDRGIIRDRKDLHDLFTTPRPASEAPDKDHDVESFFSQAPDPQQLLATFTLSREQLQLVKDAVAGEAARRGVPPPRCSSTVATFAFVWRCHYQYQALKAKAAAESSGGDRAYLCFPVDHRPRLDPPVPDKYLGNCVGPCFASAPKKALAAAGAEGLFAACAGVAAAIEEAVRGEAGYWTGWLERVMEACSDGQPLSVAGSPRFRVYDVDFGLGRPAKVDIVSVANTGAMSVAESRGSCSGGMEVGISLPPDAMDSFQRCFADAMASLQSLHAS
ncbi:hypothetical protein ACP4OV_001610 [Aristida adscensionis]